MLTCLPPYDITFDDKPRIETIFPETLSYTTDVKKQTSVFFFSEDDIKVIDSPYRYSNPKLPDFQEYFLMKSIEILFNTIKIEQDRFLIEEVDLPNEISLNLTHNVLNILSSQNIFPESITPSIEEGICLKFSKSTHNLYFEVYNDGEIGYIIEDTYSKRTIENEDLHSIYEIQSVVEKFLQ